MIVCFGAFTGPFGGNIVLALVPTLKEAFNVGVAQVLLSIPFFMMPFAICQLFSGPILDNTDKRTAIIIGLVFYALGSLCCGLSPSI